MTVPPDRCAAFRAATEVRLDPPGSGRTHARLRALFQIARGDLEVARLAEAHHDAVAIADELGVSLVPGQTYGVWAASGPDPLTATLSDHGHHLTGTVPWCTGIGIVGRALVSAHTDAGSVLVDAPVHAGEVTIDQQWASPAFAWTGTGSVHFDLDVPHDAVLGDPGSYLTRPGFWHGAVGVAACWAGGLAGLLDAHRRRWRRTDPHSLAHLGSAVSWTRCAVDVLRTAAVDIDLDPDDAVTAQARARHVRHVVERSCLAAMTDLAVGTGPEPLAFDDVVVRRTQQLELYVRQCHGERDLEPLGAVALEPSGRPVEVGWPACGH